MKRRYIYYYLEMAKLNVVYLCSGYTRTQGESFASQMDNVGRMVKS